MNKKDYRKMNGRELAQDLAEYLRLSGWLTFTEIAVHGIEDGRVDVAAVKPHQYAQKDLRAYEIKVTRQDFHADERENKWRKYLNVFHRVYFAIPAGLLTKDEIPHDAGLIVRNEKGWRVAKAPKSQKPPNLSANAVLSLLFRGCEEHRALRRLTDRISAEENIPLHEKAKNIGWEISRRLAYPDDWQKRWVTEVMIIVQQLTGKDLDEYKDRNEFKNTLKTILNLQKYSDLVTQFAELVEGFGWQSEFTTEKNAQLLSKKITKLQRGHNPRV